MERKANVKSKANKNDYAFDTNNEAETISNNSLTTLK